jgi:hypothetical protein
MGTLTDRRQYGSVVHTVHTYKGTLDVASLVDGAGTTTTVTIPNVPAPGTTPCRVSVTMGVDLAGITVTGYVSAANTVAIRFQNESGGTVDLASTTLYVVVEEYSTRAFV